MSKGTQNRVVRIDDETWYMMSLVVDYRNAKRRIDKAPWSMSDFFRIAIREKIRKMERCRGRALTEADELVDLSQLPDQPGTAGLYDDIANQDSNS